MTRFDAIWLVLLGPLMAVVWAVRGLRRKGARA